MKEDDLVQIKEELMEFGFVKKRPYGAKKPKITSRPYHYRSTDGFDIYVGKNNYQNEEVTFKIANGNDWWFHAKGIPGSHVVVRTEGKELPDRTFEEAAALAAWYSKGRDNDKVEIDYIQRKHVKKAAGGAPGFVIYHTNYSLMAEPRLVLAGSDRLADSCSLLWNEKVAHISMFQLKQCHFFVHSACISRQAAITSDHPVTGNDNGNRIMPHRTAYCLRRHTGSPFHGSQLSGNLPVGCGLPVWNLQ